jgi:hypothetical protein
MTEPEKKESILDKLRKLMDHADSANKIGNTAEAEAFAAKAQELMLKYEIELNEVERTRRNQDEPIDKTTVHAKDGGFKPRPQPQQWQLTIAGAIATAYNGDWSYQLRSNNVTFYGRTQNRELMVYMFVMLVRTGERLMKKARRDLKKERGYTPDAFQGSFLNGFAEAIEERLSVDRRKIVTNTNPHALVLLKDERDKVREWIQSNVAFSSAKPKISAGRDYSGTAKTLGYAAGQAVPLQRAAKGPQDATPKQLGGGR